MRFLIWSIEHEAWWRPGKMGYTRYVRLAGRYEEREAREILARANVVRVNECLIPADTMSPPKRETTTLTPPTEDDRDDVELMVAELERMPPLTVVFRPFSALQIVSLLQLAMRHPNIEEGTDLRDAGEFFVDHVRQYVADHDAPMTLDALDKGDDPSEDR